MEKDNGRAFLILITDTLSYLMQRRNEEGIGKFEWDDEMEIESGNKEPLTKEELESVLKYTGTKGKMSRGITDGTYKTMVSF